MKKFQFRVLAMIMMALVCVGFVSCGDDDDDDGLANLDETSQLIVGSWYRNSSYGTYSWQFNADGTCEYYYPAIDKTTVLVKKGNWSYNWKTETLTTTIDNMNYLLLNVSETSLSLTSMNGGGTVTWKRRG